MNCRKSPTCFFKGTGAASVLPFLSFFSFLSLLDFFDRLTSAASIASGASIASRVAVVPPTDSSSTRQSCVAATRSYGLPALAFVSSTMLPASVGAGIDGRSSEMHLAVDAFHTLTPPFSPPVANNSGASSASIPSSVPVSVPAFDALVGSATTVSSASCTGMVATRA